MPSKQGGSGRDGSRLKRAIERAQARAIAPQAIPGARIGAPEQRHPTAKATGAPLYRARAPRFVQPPKPAAEPQFQGLLPSRPPRPPGPLPEIGEIDIEQIYQDEGNSDHLRDTILAILEDDPGPTLLPILAHWLARYALMAGDGDLASQALAYAPDDSGMRVIRALLDPTQGGRGNTAFGDSSDSFFGVWESYPSNYYTYRYSLLKDEQIAAIRDFLDVPAPTLMATFPRPAASDIERDITSGSKEAPQRAEGGSGIETEAGESAAQADSSPIMSFLPVDSTVQDPNPAEDEYHGSYIDPTPVDLEDDEYDTAYLTRLVADAWQYWNWGLRDYNLQKFTQSITNHEKALHAVLAYFATRYKSLYSDYLETPPEFAPPIEPPQTIIEVYNYVVAFGLYVLNDADSTDLKRYTRERFRAIQLDALYEHDWYTPAQFDSEATSPLDYDIYASSDGLKTALDDTLLDPGATKTNAIKVVQSKVDGPLLMLGMVFLPLAIAEASRKYRDYATAVALCQRLEETNRLATLHVLNPLSALIEVPYLHILLGQVLLNQGDSQYKSGTPADPIQYDVDGAPLHQGLAAAETYEKVLISFALMGRYVPLVLNGAQAQKAAIEQHLAQYSLSPIPSQRNLGGDAPPVWDHQARTQFDQLCHSVPIETIGITAAGRTGNTRHPYGHLITLRNQQEVVLESNPVIYGILTQAVARLQQLDGGLDFFGHPPDFVPPWRFQYLLTRARYFTEHARAAENEYINFLYNAEREEYQEMGMQQQVALQTANVQVAAARVDVAQYQLYAAQESLELATMTAQDAAAKADSYEEFDEYATNMAKVEFGISAAASAVAVTSAFNPVDALTGGASAAATSVANTANQGLQFLVEDQQRELEQQNLNMAEDEANQAWLVSYQNLQVATAQLNVATLEQSVAILNQEFAVQNLQYLQNRTLNAEMWYRLANMIRDIGSRYLSRAIEMGFLAQRAYNFENDRNLQVIRFDYDQDSTSGLLAADYLLSDIDSLEFDLTVTQRQQQQQVHFSVSLARDYPSSLRELQATGSTLFTVLMEQIERRFPGLYNVRIGSVDATVIALMDSSRFSLALTYLGASRVRMSSSTAAMMSTQADAMEVNSSPPMGSPPAGSPPPGSPPPEGGPPGDEESTNANGVSSWIAPYNDDVDPEWPVVVVPGQTQTALYSGLARSDRDAAFAFTVSNQRGTFEGLGGAASWLLDMSMQENQVQPGTLADVLVNFTFSGNFSALLRREIEKAPVPEPVVTRWLSAQQLFSDAFYDFQQTGKTTLKVTRDLLSVSRSIGALRNIGIMLTTSSSETMLTNLSAGYAIEFEVTQGLELVIKSEIPEFHFLYAEEDTLTLQCWVENLAGGAVISWDFGDGTAWVSGAGSEATPIEHGYTLPGEYLVTLRVIRSGKLADFTAMVAVSGTQVLQAPLTARPDLEATTTGGDGLHITASTVSSEAVTTVWLDIHGSRRAEATVYTLQPGRYTVIYSAVREVQAYFYGNQRYTREDEDAELPLSLLQVSTNRVFDIHGAEQAVTYNELATQLFSGDPISPVDRWTLELPVSDEMNTFLRTVNQGDEVSLALGSIDDLLLTLEYETA